MSVPHTGHLVAQIFDMVWEFDGNAWTAKSPAHPHVGEMLNKATQASPKTHFDIKSLAEHVLSKVGLAGHYEIVSWTGDTWPDDQDLPEGAVE